jgi:hypothetical protein
MHILAPAASEKEPAGHGSQRPSRERLPTWQRTHSSSYGLGASAPGGHTSHANVAKSAE